MQIVGVICGMFTLGYVGDRLGSEFLEYQSLNGCLNMFNEQSMYVDGLVMP